MVDALFVWSVFRQIEVCRTLLGYPPQSLRDSSPLKGGAQDSLPPTWGRWHEQSE